MGRSPRILTAAGEINSVSSSVKLLTSSRSMNVAANMRMMPAVLASVVLYSMLIDYQNLRWAFSVMLLVVIPLTASMT